MNFAVPMDFRVKINESKKTANTYSYQRAENLVGYKGDGDTNCY